MKRQAQPDIRDLMTRVDRLVMTIEGLLGEVDEIHRLVSMAEWAARKPDNDPGQSRT